MLAQARSGLMDLTGFPQGQPTKTGNSIADYFAGFHCAVAILAALRYRDATGEGQYIDIALLDSLITALDSAPEIFTMTGRTVRRAGNRHFLAAGYGARDEQRPIAPAWSAPLSGNASVSSSANRRW
jgi:crotonobetainyl-CoA:carnitine CoA-transferase CaiB-like acyl-CoA transferase